MGSEEACQKMLEMEKRQPKSSMPKSEKAGIADAFVDDAEPFHGSYIDGLQKALDYFYMRKDPWDEKTTVKVTELVLAKEDIAHAM